MRYWVKLWTEMLDDPKMGRLTDRQHRLCTNLFSLAGIIDDEGRLLNTADIAYKVRRDVDGVAEDLAALAAVNIVKLVDGAWYLINFGKRNERPPSSDSADRVRQYRERRKQAGMPAGYTYDPAVITAKYGRCVYCGSTDNLVVDHAYPIILGGTDDPMNLVAACKKCNAGKAGRTPEQAGLRFIDAEAESLYMEYKKTVTVTPPRDNGDSFHVTSLEQEQSRSEADQTRARTEAEQEQEGDPEPVFAPCLPASSSSDALALLLALPMEEPNASKVASAGLDYVRGWLSEFDRRAKNGRPISNPPGLLFKMWQAGKWPDRPPGNGKDKRSIDGAHAEYIQTGTDADRHRFIEGKYADIIEH